MLRLAARLAISSSSGYKTARVCSPLLHLNSHPRTFHYTPAAMSTADPKLDPTAKTLNTELTPQQKIDGECSPLLIGGHRAHASART
jgi:hypothetical protein